MIIKLSLIVFSLLILVGYALALFFADNWSKMGIVISISVVCMDIFNYLLYISKLLDNTTSLAVLLIINRVAMVILGKRFWVYGFMGLYVLYGIALMFLVAKNTFPLKNQVVIRKKFNFKVMKTKKQLTENLKKINPFFLIVALTLLYLIFIIII